MSKSFKNHMCAGFSLIEVAIVLIIMGIVVGATMPSILRYREQAAIRETKERQELIVQAVAAFAIVNNQLPCPADPSQPLSERGVSRASCMDNASLKGIVPYRELGLSEAQAKDGFNRYMIYVIPGEAGHIGASRFDEVKNLCELDPAIKINLRGLHGEDPVQTNQGKRNEIALLLISQGLESENPSEKERVNLDSTMNFYTGPYSHGATPFRHIVKWVTARNLISIYGKGSCESKNPHTRTQAIENLTDREAEQIQPNFHLGDPFGRGE